MTQPLPPDAAPLSPKSSPQGRMARLGPFLLNMLVVVVVLYPALQAALDVRKYVVNSPHYDDLTFLEDWLKYKDGSLTWDDLFSVHLEHRVTVPRLMALAGHIMGGSDLRWQNAYTLLLMLGMLWNLAVIWRRTTVATLRASWLPLLLLSSVLFCAVQWQSLLWPILFEIFVPIFSYTVVIRLWSGRMNPWVALAFSSFFCVTAMLSFGNGPLAWVLLPFSIWFQRPDLEKSLRWKLLGAWLVLAAVALAFQFHNFHNSAPPQFAYNYDEKMTAADTVEAFLLNPETTTREKITKALDFTTAVLGSHLSRGLHMHNLLTAQYMGLASVMLFLVALVWLLVRRKDAELLRTAAPWMLLGAFSIGTATLIMLGRVSRTISGIVALLPRYTSHAVPLTLALIALVWIFGHRLAVRHPWLRTAGWIAGGAFLIFTAFEWNYGERRMELWQNARLQGKALLLFADVMPAKDFLGQVSGDGDYGAKVISELNRRGESPFPLLKNLRLDQFHISKKVIKPRFAKFEELHETADGGLLALGFAELPNKRTADLIIFTTKEAEGADQIFGISFLLRMAAYEYFCTLKDDAGMCMTHYTPEITARWQGQIWMAHKPPPRAQIKAWALDAGDMHVFAIADRRTSSEPLPPLPPKKDDDEDKR